MNLDWSLLTPEYILAGWAGLIIALDLFFEQQSRKYLGYVAALGALIAALISLIWMDETSSFSGLIQINNYTTLFRVFFGLTAVFACIGSIRYVQDRLLHPAEYYALILVSVIGANYMAGAEELLTAYISLELLSFSLYVLVSYAKFDLRSNEGGMKYMLLGAFSSAIFLYGISLVYGTTKTTQFGGIADAVSGDISDIRLGLYLGLVLIMAGLGFKVAAVPFHMWTPDAYEGAPLPITALVSAISKASGFALFLKLFSTAFLPLVDDWRLVLAGLAAATMLFGNLVALQQHNIKRLLAYSSIGQVGYLLAGVAALNANPSLAHDAASALVLHLIGYVITNVAAFYCAIIYYNWTGREEISEYRGLAERAPFLAMCMAIAMFSLSGMPLFAGFVTKFILFQAIWNADLIWLASIAAFTSFISLYYYLTVIKQMYVSPPESLARFPIPPLEYAALGLLIIGVFVVGLAPQPLFNAVHQSTGFLFSSGGGAFVAAP
ncbi:MAG TPA: NADH-quinone oxidoreductase subunit N [Dehalococcoidia bacterium]|nr:NADH-quinone oxidoreductase subunit N [Dehalococcoidia bacterium]